MAVNIIPASLPAAANPFSALGPGGMNAADEKVRAMLLAKALSTDPIQSPWQGAAQMAHALWLGMENNKAKQQDSEALGLLQNLPGLGGGGGVSPSPSASPLGMPPPAAQPDAPPPSIPAPGPQVGMPPAPPPAAPPVQMASLGPDMPLPSQAPPPVQDVTSMTPDIPPVQQGGPSPPPQELARALASDGMPAPRPPGNIPDAPKGKQAFIQSMLPHAMEASKATGIDPRVIIGQSALETGWGRKAPGNNYFGIKSHGQPGGTTFKTHEYGPGGRYAINDSFRAYKDMGDSAKGYADFINKNPRYGNLKSAQGLDAQLAALQKSGYATDPNYGAKVGQIARGISLDGAAQQSGQNVPLPRPRPPGAPQMPPEQDGAKVQFASLGGMPQGEAPLPPQGPAPQAPVQMAQAQAQIPPQIANNIKALLANPKTRAYGMQLYTAYGKPALPTDDIKEFEYAKKDPAFKEHLLEMKRAGSSKVSIDQRAEGEFDKASAKHQAERFDKLVQAGFDAKGLRADVGALRDLSKQFNTGKTAEIMQTLGPWAEALGVKIDGLGEIQAYEAIVSKMAPRMRPVGAGSSSDFDVKQYLKSLPALGNTPEGNAIIEDTMTAFQNHHESAAEIASRAMNKEITPREADKLLRELPDPLTAWKAHKKAEKSVGDSSGPVRRYNPATGKIE